MGEFGKERELLSPMGLTYARVHQTGCAAGAGPLAGELPCTGACPECARSCNCLFFYFCFSSGLAPPVKWDHPKEGYTRKTQGKGPFVLRPGLLSGSRPLPKDTSGLTPMEPVSSNGFTLDACFHGLP